MMHATQFDEVQSLPSDLAAKYEFAYSRALAEERLKLDIDRASASIDGLETYTGTPEGNAHHRAIQTLQKYISRSEMSWEVVKARHVQRVATMAFAQAVGL